MITTNSSLHHKKLSRNDVNQMFQEISACLVGSEMCIRDRLELAGKRDFKLENKKSMR